MKKSNERPESEKKTTNPTPERNDIIMAAIAGMTSEIQLFRVADQAGSTSRQSTSAAWNTAYVTVPVPKKCAEKLSKKDLTEENNFEDPLLEVHENTLHEEVKKRAPSSDRMWKKICDKSVSLQYGSFDCDAILKDLSNTSQNVEKEQDQPTNCGDKNDLRPIVSDFYKTIQTSEFHSTLKDLENEVSSTKEDRILKIDNMINYAKEFSDTALDFPPLMKILQSACDLASNYLDSNDAFGVYQRCGDFLYDFSSDLVYYSYLRFHITEKIIAEFEKLRSVVKEVSDVENQTKVSLNITYLLTICSVLRGIGSFQSCKKYIFEAMKLLKEYFQPNITCDIVVVRVLHHLCYYYKDIEEHTKCRLLCAPVFNGFYIFSDRKVDDSITACLYNLVYDIGIGYLKTFDKASLAWKFVDKQRQVFGHQIKYKVFQDILARSEANLLENESVPNLLAVVWYGHVLSEKEVTEKHAELLNDASLKAPTTPKLCETTFLLSLGLLRCKALSRFPPTKYKLANFVLEIILKFTPNLRLVCSLEALVKAVVSSERRNTRFKEYTIPFLHEAIKVLLIAYTDDEITRIRSLCNAHMYLCLCHSELEEYDECLKVASEIPSFVETLNLKNDPRLKLICCRAFYANSFVYYKTGKLEQALEEIRKEINFLNEYWKFYPRSVLTALKYFEFMNNLKGREGLASSRLFQELFSISGL